MKRKIFRLFATSCVMLFTASAYAQNNPGKELKYNLNDDGSHYVRLNFTAQVWARHNQSNPGTTVFGYDKQETFDIGLRRVRTQLFGKVHDKVFLYTQFGINNFNSISARKTPIFFHDVVAEYYITPRGLQMGMGLTAWTGFARFSAPAVASIMGYDAPLFEQATNDASDQFLRKLSIYAKGKLGKVDYRLILSDPMAVQNSTVVKPLSINSDFSFQPPKIQFSGYVMYQFLEEESNLTPYMAGTYLGRKKILNIGAGFQYQPDAMWRINPADSSTVFENMGHYASDIFYDHPLGENGAALSAYATFVHFGFGKGYLRNLGVMNTADGVALGTNSLNGAGNGFPMMGTGNVIQGQIGYLLPRRVLGEKNGQLQPYVMVMHANYDRLKEGMLVYDAGLNWYIDGYRAKLTLNYQSRPIFRASDQMVGERKGMTVLQFQIAI